MAFKVFTKGTRSAVPEGRVPRRSFLRWTTLGWASVIAAIGSCAAAFGRFMMPNVTFEPPLVFRAGRPDDFGVGRVDERFKQSHGVWIVREKDGLYALDTTCTHLGCTPNWQEAEQKFKCPCHGSGFYKDGVNFEGPAPRPLERFRIFLDDQGEIVVDKGRTFRAELDQWKDDEAFLRWTA